MVSDSFHSPRPGFFSSFSRPTGFTIGRQGVFSLTGWSPLLQSGFHVPRPTQVPFGRRSTFVYGAVTLFGLPFQFSSTSLPFGNSHVKGPTTPQGKTPAVWAVSRSLAATKEIDFSFFSLRLLRCFSSPGLPLRAYEFSTGLFGNPRINARLAASRGFSQSSTPFIAS